MRKILCVILWIQLEAVRFGSKNRFDLDQAVFDGIPREAIREDSEEENDDCEVEAKNLKQLLLDLGHPGKGPKGVPGSGSVQLLPKFL